MASKEDDTLPLPALSLEYSVDVTADEDFIPTSQPLGDRSSKVTKISGTPPQDRSSSPSAEEPNTSAAAPTDDTLPRDAVVDPKTLDQDKSSDFIPDTETKKIHFVHPSGEPSCRKKLPVFPDDIASRAQSSPLWDTQQFSALNGSPVEANPSRQDTSRSEKSIPEIIVNDSAETVDLEGSPTKGAKSEKLSVSLSIDSDAGRCEETQVFESSSVVLLEQPGGLTADQSEKSIKEPTPSQDLYLARTIDDESDLQERLLACQYSPPAAAAADTTGTFNHDEFGDSTQSKENGIPQCAPSAAVKGETSNVTTKMDFYLTVTCYVTFNPKTNKVSNKFISKVSEVPRPQPKSHHFDHPSDYTSDKSKRYSTSSSGSVYSDKHGLPFKLSKRVSAVSDQTDSSEEDLGARMEKRRRAIERTPWGNEYLLPVMLDELVQASIENPQMTDRVPSLREANARGSADMSLSKDAVKSSSSEAKSVGEAKSQTVAETAAGNATKTPETVNSVPPEGVDAIKSDNESDPREVSKCEDKREDSTTVEVTESAQPQPEPEPEASAPAEEEREVEGQDQETSSIALVAGLRVLARWTDKRYYSGVLREWAKNDRWEVEFDDGTMKTMREEFIMPMEWLKVGSLVFTLDGDRYTSGQIVEIQQGKEVTFAVELDEKKETVSAQSSDLCLSDVMAGIIKEKYRPPAGTPRKITDIDFDNVLSGKRRREQRTPSRPSNASHLPSSETKKTSTSRKRKDELETVEETPEGRGGGLKSVGGHLVEDKVASADSPSEDEAEGTPLRGSSKDPKGKAKPRILCYGYEVPRPRRGKLNKWLTDDGIPIPGPSGVKFHKKKKKPHPKEEDDADEPPSKKPDQEKSAPRVLRGTRLSGGPLPAPGRPGEEKGRKRRLDGVAEESVQKKTTRGDVRTKSKSRK